MITQSDCLRAPLALLRALGSKEYIMLACNKCQNKLTEQKSCVFCDDFKTKYLSVVSEAPTVSAKTVLLKALNAIATDMGKLEEQLNYSEAYDPALSSELQKTAKSMTMISDSIRKLEDSGEEERDLTFSENLMVFEEYLGEQPVMLQKQAMAKLTSRFGNGSALKAS